MANTLTCPRCGCRRSHFSPGREIYVCDDCGNELPSENDIARKEQYIRSVNQAKRHLQAGNWNDCASIIRPMLRSYPTETELYLLILAALTKGYEDYMLDNRAEVSEAAAIWDNLERLHTVNSVMSQYAAARRSLLDRILKKRIILSAVLLAGMLIGFFTAYSMSAFLPYLLLAAFYIFAISRIVNTHKPFSAIAELCSDGSSNPFR